MKNIKEAAHMVISLYDTILASERLNFYDEASIDFETNDAEEMSTLANAYAIFIATIEEMARIIIAVLDIEESVPDTDTDTIDALLYISDRLYAVEKVQSIALRFRDFSEKLSEKEEPLTHDEWEMHRMLGAYLEVEKNKLNAKIRSFIELLRKV